MQWCRSGSDGFHLISHFSYLRMRFSSLFCSLCVFSCYSIVSIRKTLFISGSHVHCAYSQEWWITAMWFFLFFFFPQWQSSALPSCWIMYVNKITWTTFHRLCVTTEALGVYLLGNRWEFGFNNEFLNDLWTGQSWVATSSLIYCIPR